MSKYNTNGKQMILDMMAKSPDELYTAEMICSSLGENAPGQSTGYRLLSSLCECGSIKKFRDDGEGFVYGYVGDRDCKNHFHIKCTECGRIIHLECVMGHELANHIEEHHGFKIDIGRSIMYGVCSDCQNKKEQV
ncbi:MAG: transcriptional repressor [Clostridia bacterium]|nr:transcriptional repressor [Clostridia bacterium]